MIARYRDKIYKARVIKSNKIAIWTTDIIEKFNKIVEGDYICFEKECNKSELQELYDINFFTEWSGRTYGCCITSDDMIYFQEVDSATFAEEHGFQMVERGVYEKKVPIEECSHFGYVKHDYLNDEIIRKENISIAEFKQLFSENVIDLM